MGKLNSNRNGGDTYVSRFQVLTIVFFGFLMCTSNTLSQNRDDTAFDIVSGSVTVTPSGFGGAIEPKVSTMSGSFVGFLPGGGTQLFFPSSSIVTSPVISFTLPEDPNFDSGGTVRNATFIFDERGLAVKGKIDARAFDGPLIEYSFKAQVSNTEFSAHGMFSARPDFRRCVAPLCGGFFVKQVNKANTQCADGTMQTECYVASLKVRGTHFSDLALPNSVSPRFRDATPYVFRGEISPKDYPNFGNLGVLKATEAYRPSGNGKSKGRFYGIKDSGIRCIQAPCYSLSAYALNGKKTYKLTDYHLEKSEFGEHDINQAMTIMSKGGVLFTSGTIQLTDELIGQSRRLVIEQVFLPIL